MSPIITQSMDKVNHKAARAEDELMELVHRVMHQYRTGQYEELRGHLGDLTHMESKVLGYVGRHPGSTQSDLARASGRDKAQLARLVKALRERGLLAVAADAADRRNLQMALTPAGGDVLRLLQQHTQRLASRAVRGLDAAERSQLVALLQRVSDNLRPRED
jgi:DNA-binding MarR family transcriptional regulator